MSYKTYEKYRDSGIDWIGDMPQHWKLEKLKHILNQRNEKNNPIKTKNILSLTAKQGVIPLSEKEHVGGNKPKDDLTQYKLAYPNDIVLNSMNIISGAVGLSEYYGCVSPVYYMFYSNNNNINIEYYNYIFQIESFQRMLLKFGKGILIRKSDSGKLNTIRMKIPMESFKDLELPLIDIETQNSIVNYLNENVSIINNKISKLQQLTNLLEEKKISLINQVVTKGLDSNVLMKDSGIDWIGEIPQNWQITKIRFLGSLQNGISKSSEYFGCGYPFVGYGDVYNNEELPRNVSGKANTSIDERIKYSVIKNDIFFTRTSEVIDEVGISSLCTETIEDATFSGFLIRLRLFKNIDINVNFLKYYLQSISIRHYFAKMMVIVTRASLGQNLLNNLSVLIPPKEEQIEISNYLDKETVKIDKTIDIIQKDINLLEEYKTSLIHYVVTGKIDVSGDKI